VKIKRQGPTFLFGQRAMMLHKDLLNLVFQELEYGHDMINFSEINRRCYQLFHQHFEVVRTTDFGHPIIYTQKKTSAQCHGLSRFWYNNYENQLQNELNFYNDQRHGVCRWWYGNGKLGYYKTYQHGKLHGIYKEWSYMGHLKHSRNYSHGKIEKIKR